MPIRNLFVIGASAGGLDALKQLASGLPADLDAAVLVVLHTAPDFPSFVHEFLATAGNLPASQARHDELIVPGRIYVAPPDRHLLVRHGKLALSRGPRENFSRPAIDPLFRSAAQTYGPKVTGVVLSGTLGDGTVGLMVIKAHGGTTVAQDPRTVQFSEMPQLAIASAPVDYILPIDAIATLLAQKAGGLTSTGELSVMKSSFDDADAAVKRDLQAQVQGLRNGQTATYSCPECGGTLWQIDDQGAMQFRCHVGHAYAPEALLLGMSTNLENALWSAVRALVERATINRQLAKRHRQRGQDDLAAALEEQAEQDDRYMKMIRESILGVQNGDAKPLTYVG